MADETVKVNLDIGAMVERFRALGPLMGPTVYSAMLVSAERMVRDVVSKRMSGPRGAPGILGVVSGHARKTMLGPATFSGSTVTAALGSPVDYVRTHELGFHGPVHVRAHLRLRLGAIKAVSIAQATRAKVVKRGAATAAQRKAGVIAVRAFDRKVSIMAKHFIRDTVLEAKVPVEDRILKALMLALKTGRVPVGSQLGA